jgi:hypothetical protein
MRVAIHQPNFLPWLGYFYKLARCDLFVILDDAQFSKEGYINRTMIKTTSGKQWLSVPIRTKGRMDQRIGEAEIEQGRPWQRKNTETLRQAYAKAPHYAAYGETLEEILARPRTSLVQLNLELLGAMARFLGVETPVLRASEIQGVDGASTQRLVSICRSVGAAEYLSGQGGHNYQDEQLFQDAGIRLVYNDFVHPVYPQLHGEFQAGLSAIDLLFNVGEASRDVLSGAGALPAGRGSPDQEGTCR